MFSAPVYDYIKEIEALSQKHPELDFEKDVEMTELTRAELMEKMWERTKRMMQIKPEVFTNNDKHEIPLRWGFLFTATPGVVHLHQTMFTTCIKMLASPEQKKSWLPLANNLNILGGYSQTELGHGSNVTDLETTATLDMAKDEFVIHTPHIRATKFWPGGLGLVGTHSIVFARLILEDNDYGIQPFMVQVRSLEDHKAMPGIEVGDIGSKLGYNTIDNAYLSFNNVRIPRTDLLSRFVYVEKDGSF